MEGLLGCFPKQTREGLPSFWTSLGLGSARWHLRRQGAWKPHRSLLAALPFLAGRILEGWAWSGQGISYWDQMCFVDIIKNLSSSTIKEKEFLDLFEFEADEDKNKKQKKIWSIETGGGYKSPGSLQRPGSCSQGGGPGAARLGWLNYREFVMICVGERWRGELQELDVAIPHRLASEYSIRFSP